MLIRFKTNKDNGVSIIDNGKAYIFNSIGVFEDELPLTPSKLDGILNLPIISIISSNSNTDIMVHNLDDTEKFYSTKASAMDCATKLSMSGDFVRTLRKNGKFEGKTYNQILFVYKENADISSKLSLLSLEERK